MHPESSSSATHGRPGQRDCSRQPVQCLNGQFRRLNRRGALHVRRHQLRPLGWDRNPLRLSGATLVVAGRIDKLKTRTGARLTDSLLVQLHKDKHPWLPAVYEHLSGYVHFSGSHISDSIEVLGEEEGDRTIQFLISDQDLKFPEFSWTEILKCFREATSILGTYLQGWGATKKLSDAQLQALRGDA